MNPARSAVAETTSRVYADGSASCFGFQCEHWEPPTDGFEGKERRISTPKEFKTGVYVDLPDRGLTRDTLEFWNYQVNVDEKCHIANYRDERGDLTHQKIRRVGKKFSTIGGSDLPLYGAWLWGGGRSIVITEGELDALSVSQAFKNKYPVVSVPTGVDSLDTLERSYEYLDRFEKIILMFDQDDKGRPAAEAAATVLPMGKVHIAVLPHKDANDVLKNDGAASIVSAYWNAVNAKPWRPDGIISGADISVEDLMEEMAPGYEIVGCPDLQEKLMGWRKGELTLLTAGSGIGKSTWTRQIAFNLHQSHGLRIGNVFLEEQFKKTAKAYVALYHSVPLSKLRANSSLLSREQYVEARDAVTAQRMSFYNHFGSLEQNNLLAKLRYMATVEKCDFIFLDHISIVTSGVESSARGRAQGYRHSHDAACEPRAGDWCRHHRHRPPEAREGQELQRGRPNLPERSARISRSRTAFVQRGGAGA
jgi:twinkle protein